MSQITRHLGDDGGEGHEIKVIHQDDGTVLLLSHNPDTDEVQRIVLLENQWRLLLRTLLEEHGKEKCCYFKEDGSCAPSPEQCDC